MKNGQASKILTIALSIVATILGVYFTDIFFKPQLQYTLTGFKIELPQAYEKEIAKVRAKLFMQDFEKQFGAIIKSGTASPNIKEGHISFDRTVSAVKPVKSTKLKVDSSNTGSIIDALTNPDVLRKFVSVDAVYPTAFATVRIFNSGNRSANNVDLEIKPNGVLVEAQVTSTEPSIKEFDKLMDPSIGLPIGLSISNKRLVPKGYIEIRLYWHMLSESSEKDAVPTLTINGTHSSGVLQKAEDNGMTELNKPILIIGGIGLFLLGMLVSIPLYRKRIIRKMKEMPK